MSDQHVSSSEWSVDLTNCDREPIHVLGHVQPFGCLLSVSSDWIVNHASLNVSKFLGFEATDLIGQPLGGILSGKVVHEIRTRLQILHDPDSVERIFGIEVFEDDPRLFDLAIHYSGRSVIIELEPAETTSRKDYTSYVRPLIGRIQKVETVEALCQSAAKHLRALTGFDRIMVYRFASDGSGEVIAEAKEASLEAFQGLHYPASDIPKQARELYKRNLLRIISDVDADVSPIIPATNPEGQPLDLSLSGLRAVSPIHLEYLRNMGVKASMSISIMIRGELWGLFACHHYQPLVLSYEIRSAAELFGQLFAFVLDQKENDEAREQTALARKLHDRLMSQIADGASIADNFTTIVDALASVIPCDGAIGWIDGHFQKTGSTPTKEQFLTLVRFLNTTAASSVYATDHLSAVFPAAEGFVDCAAGLLALPVSRMPRDYIVLFRQERAKTVKWAGNPEKPFEPGPNGIRLTPRKSFEAWQQIVHGQSAEWLESELLIAESLRITLLEVVLRLADAANKERARAQDHQEILIAELNHRVRNILSLIRGLVAQSQSEVKTVGEFTEVVGERIHALSRAHDQITNEKWSAASFRALIETEMEAYLVKGNTRRVDIEGPDVLVEPQAFITLSLVIHEMMTNSMKYGALSVEGGRIAITLSKEDDGALLIHWREGGGPAVNPPQRHGFGTTIIEQSIPFELKGTVEIRYEPTGVRAVFRVPGNFVQDASAPHGAAVESVSADQESWSGSLGNVLVLEDNMIIALDAEDLLKMLGAENVYVASTNAEASKIIDANDIDFCLLDVNLGTQTSEVTAQHLLRLGTPFIFATGYGENDTLRTLFPDAPIIQKPYDSNMLRGALAKIQQT